MIRRLTGNLLSKTDHAAVLDVHGVGYLVNTPQTHFMSLDAIVSLHTHLVVRENVLDLYGFQFEDELDLFEKLITLPKIGPKSALQIMTQANLELITTAVVNNDAGQLSKMSGISKKTAEKIVSGLIEVYEKSGSMIGLQRSETAGGAGYVSDTIDALIALGYPEQVARKTVQLIVETKPELINTNDILREALRQLS